MIWFFRSPDAERASDVRQEFIDLLRLEGSDEGDFCAAEMIFGELVGNVVRHAPGPIEVRLEWTTRLPVLSVRDSGPGFKPRTTLPDDMFAESGRGLFIVRNLAKQLAIASRPGEGTTVSVTLPVPHRVAA